MTEVLDSLKERNITFSIQSTGKEFSYLFCFHHQPGTCLLLNNHSLSVGIEWLGKMADKYFPMEGAK